MYNILWFDDDFTTVKSDDPIIEARRKSFKIDVEKAKNYDLQYDSACTIEEFEKKIQQNNGQYQVVILDLMGLNPNDSADDSGIFIANQILSKTHGVLKYVLSNNTNNPKFETFIKINFGEDNIFSKATDVDWDSMFSKIKSDLDGNLYYYIGHEECLQLFNKRYLTGSNKSKMDEAMRCYNDKGKAVPLTFLRILLEDMLFQFAKTKQPHMTLDPNNHRDRLNYLIRDCHTDINGKFDYNNPMVPFSECPQEVKNCIEFTWNMCSNNSHNQLPPAFLSPSDYELQSKEAIYNAFFVTMIWYYRYMTQMVP